MIRIMRLLSLAGLACFAVLGAPTDEGSPWKPGARFAPRKIRELSVKYAGYGPVQHQLGYYDIDEDRRYLEYERRESRIVDCGDSDIVYTNVRRTFDNITRDVRRILDAGAFPVVIGGDHAVTYPVVRAYTERLNVVHFDAHMDYRPFVHGVQWANGNPIRNVARLKTCHHIVQVGIRSLRTRQADVEDSRARGNDVVTIPDLLLHKRVGGISSDIPYRTVFRALVVYAAAGRGYVERIRRSVLPAWQKALLYASLALRWTFGAWEWKKYLAYTLLVTIDPQRYMRRHLRRVWEKRQEKRQLRQAAGQGR